ncbi:MAG TPA: hypothetical protein PLN33_08125 [Hyphomonadaceae bacterium]|jgi:hypothetical protein|nr:hypothetical protein [Hyphomonadaceae bacterium]HPN04912.1 hypothetical protein [Hyphomonadaceae bacterium]
MFFNAKPNPANFSRTLVGEWHADTSSGDVRGEITAIFNMDGSWLTRNQMEIRGVQADPVTQTGRYRVEAVDKQRFKLFTIDENGQPLSTTVRSFVDKNTMLNEVGRITFKRVEQPQQPLF